METGKLYRVNRANLTPNAGVILKGATVDMAILGSQSKPDALTDMVDLTGEGTITEAGGVAFVLLPEYIAFSGTADAIEVVGVSLTLVGNIA